MRVLLIFCSIPELSASSIKKNVLRTIAGILIRWVNQNYVSHFLGDEAYLRHSYGIWRTAVHDFWEGKSLSDCFSPSASVSKRIFHFLVI